MRTSFALALAAFVLLPLSCASQRGLAPTPILSVERLLSSPKRFDGDRLLVGGFLLMPATGDAALYQHEPDPEHPPERRIRLEAGSRTNELMRLQLKHCLVEGRFHVGQNPGPTNYLSQIEVFELARPTPEAGR